MKPLAFIGMSGAGKSHWSGELAKEGFIRFCCDDLIAAELRPLLTVYHAHGGMDGASI